MIEWCIFKRKDPLNYGYISSGIICPLYNHDNIYKSISECYIGNIFIRVLNPKLIKYKYPKSL